MAGIKHCSDVAELLQNTSLIIRDEAHMHHRHGIESVDRCLRDIIAPIDEQRFRKPFGGITVVFGGDYRQILPVIPKATRAVMVGVSLNRTRLWMFCKVFLLHQDIRLHSRNYALRNKVIGRFSKWQLSIGDGIVPGFDSTDDNEEVRFEIPDQFVVHQTENPVQDIFTSLIQISWKTCTIKII